MYLAQKKVRGKSAWHKRFECLEFLKEAEMGSSKVTLRHAACRSCCCRPGPRRGVGWRLPGRCGTVLAPCLQGRGKSLWGVEVATQRSAICDSHSLHQSPIGMIKLTFTGHDEKLKASRILSEGTHPQRSKQRICYSQTSQLVSSGRSRGACKYLQCARSDACARATDLVSGRALIELPNGLEGWPAWRRLPGEQFVQDKT